MMIPALACATIELLKKDLQQKINQKLIEISSTPKEGNEYFYQLGKTEAYFEILELIESDENG